MIGLCLAGAALVLGPAPAARAAGPEQIQDYVVALDLAADGSMQVTETITYDFGDNARHGIFRNIPAEFATNDSEQLREYPIDNVSVNSPSGAPTNSEITGGSSVDIRIGDPDRTVTGVQTYVIRYRVGGVTNSFADHQELYWNAIGTEWSVTIAKASVTVSGPGAATKGACFEGSQGSTQTCAAAVSGGKAVFGATDLAPASGMTVVASFPTGTFPADARILKTRQTLARAFTLNAGTGAGALGVFALLAGGAGALVSRKGRDEQYLGVTPGLAPGLGQDQRTARVGAFRRPVVAVQFTPPDQMRPGQLGTLIDEQANVVDVTATIVDLAVRGFLTIEEVSQPGIFRGGDWKLAMTWPAPTDQLHDYELALLQAVFENRSEVLLSDLKQTFRADLTKVQSMLYADVTRNGWFHGDPSSVRSRWQFLGVLLVVAGGGLTYLLTKVLTSTLGLLGLAVGAAGLVLLVLAPRMPARTAKGTALLAQAKGFRTYLETAEANQIRYEEGEDIFSRYLPFAIVFGVAERWAKVFAQLAAGGAAMAAPTWYVGNYYAAGIFDYNGFGRSMDSFSTTTSGSIAAATPSSSGDSGFGGGGFSGGGGGGGGGGSW